MKRKLSLVLFLAALLAVMMLCGAAENEADVAEQQETPLQCETEIKTETKQDYTHLRATRYKNLYATKYPNLAETLIRDEIKAQEQAAGVTASGNGGSSGGGNWTQSSVGSAANPGYSGSVGKYSLNDKTVAAHLTVQGTNVQDRAIWQADGNTNYYTSGSVTWAAGSAHLRSGELSQNTVIYGHNWGNCFVPFKKTGPEFESLMAYSYEDFVAENQYIYLTTNSGVHTYKVFAVCFTKDLSFYINCNNIDVSDVADKAKSMSLFDFGISVGDNDKIITLSTCTRYYSGLGANQRFIIMGKLVD